ncbi:DUF5131 family protein [Roseibium sp.]|uniref:DUF5131 family protein n=1 Tax=Roseibium sp. TaxID=1936156 RepID=UPI003B5237DF
MAENSNIEWCHHTFNPWIGCTKVSPACDHCYAEAQNEFRKWNKEGWGPKAARKRTSDSNWKKPLKWDREAKAAGERRRVFCASLADVFDNHSSILPEWRADLWELIAKTPNLDWLLLTKRPQNIAKYLPNDSSKPWYRPWNMKWPWPNVWLGTSTENQTEWDRRWPILASIPAAVRFISAEPLLSRIVLRGPGRLDWLIAGGESGSSARPMHPDIVRTLRDECASAGVPFLFKQWGEWAPATIEDLPARFTDPECERFRCISSCGFVGDLSIGSAFLHKPDRFPDCFPNGADGDAICKSAFVRRVGKKAAGRLLDGVLHDGYPNVVEVAA